MSTPKEPLREAIEIIGRLKGQMMKRAGFSDYEVYTFLNHDPETKKLEMHLNQSNMNFSNPFKKMEATKWNPTTEGENQKPKEVKTVLVLTDESSDHPKTGIHLPMLGWYEVQNNGNHLKRVNVTFWREYELPK